MVMLREKSWKLAFSFTVIWAGTVLYGEMFAYWLPFWTNSWPHHSYHRNEGGLADDFVKVAVLADPQLMDRTSHALPPLALEMAQFYTDLYMRRAFLSSILPHKPDVILFLGDYFDGGPRLSNEEWQESLNRFKHIFDQGKGKSKGIPVYYIPGNHDIGYVAHIVHKPEVAERYESYFGARNHNFTVGGVDFIAIDAQTVDGNSEDSMTSKTWKFVDTVATGKGANQRILLTHIPLYRPDRTSCGPYRTSDIINQWISHSPYNQRITYQNYVTQESSNRLLHSIRPVLVLSGHDHDQCTVTHETKDRTVKEHTLGTASWQQGNWYPSFMLLSIGNIVQANVSSPEPVILVHLCFLPQQLFIYIWYIILFVITILALSLWPSHGVNLGHHLSNFMTNIKKLVKEGLSGTKEKNEDENCEYEMIWDAEGGMHLVKKAREASAITAKETSAIERGNAVMRAGAARRQSMQEQEASTKLEIDGDSSSTTKASVKPSRSVMRLLLQRCLRVLGMVFVIAVVNVPLYMMLLFKDWAEQ